MSSPITVGRIIAIGDIHGCADALDTLINEIQPTFDDTIITLGDYVDRGPASKDVIEILIDLVSRCRFFPLLGNHELMMAAAFNSRVDYEFWLQHGGRATLHSYGGDIRQIPAHHRTFLNHCQRFHETDTHFFVHASYEADLPLEDQEDEVIFWRHVEDHVPEQHYSNKIGIVGHTPQESGDIRDLGHLKIIDTFCYGDGWLTAFDVGSGQTWQARMDGQLREVSDQATLSNSGQTDLSDDDVLVDEPPSPLEIDGDRFKALLDQVSDWIADFLDDLPDAIVHPGDVANLDTSGLRELPPESPTDLNHLLERIFSNYVHDSFNTTSPGYLAYVPGGGFPEAAVADLIAQITNRFITVWGATPQLAQIEATVVDWFCNLIGYGKGSGGYLTSGGSTANQTAIVTARTKLLKNNFSRATIYASDQSHHCLKKSAFLAGIPRENFREVESTEDFKIAIEQLRKTIRHDISQGFIPFMLVGNGGTTNTGAVDDLVGLRRVADEFNLWFHVDGAYGGFFCMTDRGRQQLSGIESADSIVLDPHKGLFMPYGTGCLLVRDVQTLLDTHSFTSDYMPEMTGDINRLDLCEISPELSRGNRSLRLWLPIKHHGIGVFRDLLDEKLDLANWSAEQIEQMNDRISGTIEIVAKPELSILAFRLANDRLPLESQNSMNQRWLDAINADGRVMLTGTTVNGKFVLRICILSFRTHLDRMQDCMQIIESSANTIWLSQVS